MSRSAFRVLIAIVMLMTTTPLATLAQSGTPEAPAPVVESTETPALPAAEPTVEVTDPPSDETPTNPTEPAGPESTEPVAPIETGAAETPVTRSGNPERSLAPTNSLQEADTFLMMAAEQCGNDDRIGEFDFLFGPVQAQTLAADTSYDCVNLLQGIDVVVTLTPAEGGEPISPFTQGGVLATFSVPAGSYTVTVTVGEQTGTSDVTLDSGSAYQMAVVHYVAEQEQPAPDSEGTGDIGISYTICHDDSRAISTSFLIIGAPLMNRAAAAPTPCEEAGTNSTSFLLTNANDATETYGPLVYNGLEDTSFDDIPTGSYTLTDVNTGSVSEPFTILAGASTQVTAIAYLPETTIDLLVEKIWCEDNDRAGQTDFTLDTSTLENRALAASSTCRSTPAYEVPELTITLQLVGTDISFRDTLEYGVWFYGIPAGSYTLTESDGTNMVTSDPMDILESGQRVRIINYIEEGEWPEPGTEGQGDLYGLLLFCQSPDHADGDVDFLINASNSVPALARAVSTCETARNAEGLVTVYPVDPNTNEPDLTAGIPARNDGGGNFYTDWIPAGTYVLGYTDPAATGPVLSEPFPVYDGSFVHAEINVYSAPVYSGWVDVYKDICVDPARVGQATFSVIDEPYRGGPEFAPQAQVAAAATNCRYGEEEDGPFLWTLTNTDTGRIWTSDGAYPTFYGIPAGTYTLTEQWRDLAITSQAFAFDPQNANLSIYVRNFIADADWDPYEGEYTSELYVSAMVCTSPDHDGGAEFVLFDSGTDPSTTPGSGVTNETSRCRWASEEDGLVFEAIPQDVGENDDSPVSFTFDGHGGFYSDREVDPGTYIVNETTTGATTGVIRAGNNTYIEFYKYEPLPRADVTVTIRSEDPTIANALPAGATWTVSKDGVELFSDTFSNEHLQLPVTIPVTNPMPYGTYTITIDGTPDFLFYSGIRVVDEPTEAFEFVLIPVEDVQLTTVALNVTSADLGAANRLPDNATWTVTSVDNPDLVLSGVFAENQRDLPLSFTLDTQLPDGQYVVEIAAGPAFAPYREIFAVGADTVVPLKQGFFALQQEPATVWDIVLQPVVTPATPTPSPSPTQTPSPSPSATPGSTATPGPSATPGSTATPDPSATSTSTPAATPGTTVTTLPTTGQGSGIGSASALLLLAATGAVIAALGGLAIRRKHA